MFLGAIRSAFIQFEFINKATAPIKQLNSQVDKVRKDIDKNTKAMRDALTGIGVALTGVGAAGGFFFKGATKDLADYQDGMVGFRKMAGDNADQLLADIKRMSGGTVDSLSAIQNANRAMTMGIDQIAIPRMMEIARAAAKTQGKSIQEMYESIILGTARQSRLLLDNLGIIVSVEEANTMYAKSIGKTVSQLTEEEKRLAFQYAVMVKGQAIIDKTDLSQKSLNEEMQKAAANWRELKMELARGALPVIKRLISTVQTVLDAFRGLPEPVKKTIGLIAILTTVVAAILGPLALLGAALFYIVPAASGAALMLSGMTAAQAAAVAPTLTLTGAIGTLGGAIWAALAPILPIIAAIGILILIIQDLYVGMKGGRSVIMDLYDKLGIFKLALLPLIWPIMAVIEAFRHWDEITEILSGLWTKLKGLWEIFKTAGKMLIDAFLEGMTFGLVNTDKLASVFDTIREYLPFSDAKKGPLADLTLSGQRFMETFAKGAQLAVPGISLPFAGISNMIQGRTATAPISVSVSISDVHISGDETSLKTMATMTAGEVEKVMMKVLNLQAKRSGI